ncbi:MAG: hypothetical protein J7M26_01875, partial [Armatimonadetes bacterium]|nr:hypothetical protein [Armatimonadota bacterium]
RPRELGAWVHGDGVGQTLWVRLSDATGQTHQFKLGQLDFTDWRRLSCSLAGPHGYWGGAKDGKLHLPLTFDRLIMDSDVEPSEGDVYFDDLTYVTLAEPAEAVVAQVETGWFGHVVFPQGRDPVDLKVAAINRRLDAPVRATLEATVTDCRGRRVAQAQNTAELTPGQRVALSLHVGPATGGLLTVAVQCNGKLLTHRRVAVLRPPPPLRPVRDPFFGVCTHFGQGKHQIPETLELMRRAGVEFFRDELYWGALERERGKFDFPERYDAYMQSAAKVGLQPLIVMTYANRLYDDGQAPHTPTGREAYARYATELVKHYGKICRRWEVWNEPNIGFWRGRKPNPDEYFELLRTTYTAVKQTDPSALVLGVCTAGTDFRFIEGVLKRGGGQYMDALSIHPYRYPRSPEASRFVDELNRTRALMDRYGMAGKKLWLTEIGWPTQHDRRGVDEQTSANYLVRMFVLARTLPYVGGVVWYDWQDDGPNPTYNEHNFGLTKWRTSEAKAGLVAFWVMSSHLSGASFERKLLPREPDDQRYAFVFTRQGGRVLVAWSAGDEADVSWQVGAGRVRLQWADAQVEERELPDGLLRLHLTAMPVFVTLPAKG